MLDPKFNPKFQVSKFVIGTNFADFARRFRLIMREARVNASMQRMFLAQSLPDAMTDHFWIYVRIRGLWMRFWTTSPRYTRLKAMSISRHECATSVKMSPRELEINGLRPPPKLELLQFLAKIRMSHDIRLMRPSTVLRL